MNLSALKNIQLTKQQQQLLFAVLLFGGFGIFSYHRYFWAPLTDRREKTAVELTEAESKIARAKAKAGKLKELEISLAQLEKAVEIVEKKLPREKDVAGVLETIYKLALAHRIRLQSFQPQSPADRNFFFELPFSLSFSGAYHDLGKFLAALGSSERILSAKNLSLNASGGDSSAGGTIGGAFILVAYQYKG
ncbi:MAG: type 4a pilus biogenesis protein PilO [Elusimicrobia bacterium]|nr:type 4a pilus biogenesis protein PilO [Elusimicrobiota bacterium]